MPVTTAPPTPRPRNRPARRGRLPRPHRRAAGGGRGPAASPGQRTERTRARPNHAPQVSSRIGGPWWSQRRSGRRRPSAAASRVVAAGRGRPVVLHRDVHHGDAGAGSSTAAVMAAVSSGGQYSRVTECHTTVSTSSATGSARRSADPGRGRRPVDRPPGARAAPAGRRPAGRAGRAARPHERGQVGRTLGGGRVDRGDVAAPPPDDLDLLGHEPARHRTPRRPAASPPARPPSRRPTKR